MAAETLYLSQYVLFEKAKFRYIFVDVWEQLRESRTKAKQKFIGRCSS